MSEKLSQPRTQGNTMTECDVVSYMGPGEGQKPLGEN